MIAMGSRQRVGVCCCSVFAALAACSSVWADSTTVALTGASTVSTNAPVTMQFPITRTGDIGYDAILHYHTADGTALAGVDYTAAVGDTTIPVGVTTTNIPVTIAANSGPGTSKTFQLVVDSIVGVGPQANFAAQYAFATGLNPRCVRAADINADGKPDLIVADTSDNTVSVLLNSTVPGSTASTFSARQSFATGVQPFSIVIVDINGDGRPDVVAANYDSNSVSVLLNTTVPGSAQPTFVMQLAFAVGTNPISVDAADINRDGKPDLIVANHGSNTVSVLLNNTAPGATVPSFGVPQHFDAGNSPSSVVAVDINDDGMPDVAVTNNADDTVAVMLNKTVPGAVAAGFATKQTFATGTQPVSVSAADINGDGKPELIVANYADADVSVLVNDTAPGAMTLAFEAQQTFMTEGFPISVAAVDLNGDGKPDLVAANRGSTGISILRNTTVPGSAARFSPEQTFASADIPIFVAAADINGDGKPDLIAANFATSSVSVLVNTVATPASSDFAPAQTFAAGTNPNFLAQADLNGDNKPDLVVVNTSDSTVSVLLNNTPVGAMTQSFASQQTFATGSMPNSVAIADIDGDGKPDLVVANSGTSTVSVLFNTTANDTMIASFAAQQTIAASNPTSLIAADINGDHKPDLLYVNGAYSAVLINTTVTGSMAASFAAQQTFGTGGGAIIASDINGDGKPDLIEALGDGVAVLLNTTAAGAPVASFAAQQAFGTGAGGTSVVAVDINRDGKPDLAISSFGDNHYQSNHVSVLLNITPTGAQTPAFAARQDFDSGDYPTFLSAADINGDGAPDLVVTNSEGAAIMLNNTAPGAAAPSYSTQRMTGGQFSAVTAADVNGDGKPDLIGITAAGAVVQLNTMVSQTATANFAAQQEVASIASAANCCRPSVAIADINRDGKPDVITVDGGYVGGQFAVLLNTTPLGAISSIFGPPESFPIAGVIPESVVIADINGDGLPDVITANSNSGGASVALNTTPAGAMVATFSSPLTLTLGNCTDSVSAADLNGDGRPDLIVGDCGFSASVLINTTPVGASVPSFADPQSFYTTGDGSVIATDLNGDGKRDLLGIYVSAVGLVNTTAPGSTLASFAAQQDFGTVSGNGGQLIATDLNGDGKPDIAAAPASNYVELFLNSTAPGNSTVGFARTEYTFPTTALDGYASLVVGADVDGDGRTDLITDDTLDNTASVLLNTTPPGASTPSFVWQHAMDSGYFPVSIVSADINGDGKPDLLTTHYENGVISVLLNSQYQTIMRGSPAIGTIVPDDIFANEFD